VAFSEDAVRGKVLQL